MPSNFDRENRAKRQPIAFLNKLERNLTGTVARDDKVHIEYVPTQVVTEYVRHRLKDAQGEPMDGILYRSSRDHTSKAAVIFAEPEQCGPRERERWLAPEFLLLLNNNVRYASPYEFRELCPPTSPVSHLAKYSPFDR